MSYLTHPGRIFEIISNYENFRDYPFVYYVTPNGVSDVPTADGVEVRAYAAVIMGTIVVLQSIGDGEVAYIDALEYHRDTNTYVSTDVVPIVDAIYEFLSGNRDLGSLSDQARMLIAELFEVPIDYVEEMIEVNRLTPALRDRRVAIIGTNVFVLAKGNAIVERYEGNTAVRVAREVSYVVRNPASALAGHITRAAGGNAIIFATERGSLLCSRRGCWPLPVPLGIATILSGPKLRVVRAGDDVDWVPLPQGASAVALGRRKAFVLACDEDENASTEPIKCNVLSEVQAPLWPMRATVVYGRRGIVGYGAPLKGGFAVYKGTAQAVALNEDEL